MIPEIAKKGLAIVPIHPHNSLTMSKTSDKPVFESVAEFMRASGMDDRDLAKLLDIDRSLATKLRLGHKFRSLRGPLKVSQKCKVPIERLVA